MLETFYEVSKLHNIQIYFSKAKFLSLKIALLQKNKIYLGTQFWLLERVVLNKLHVLFLEA